MSDACTPFGPPVVLGGVENTAIDDVDQSSEQTESASAVDLNKQTQAESASPAVTKSASTGHTLHFL